VIAVDGRSARRRTARHRLGPLERCHGAGLVALVSSWPLVIVAAISEDSSRYTEPSSNSITGSSRLAAQTREELVMLDVSQVSPREPGLLREAKRAHLTAVVGKGGTTRTVFRSADARTALADYLEHERPRDASGDAPAVFLSAAASRHVGRVGGSRRGRSTRSWSGSGAGMTLSTAIQRGWVSPLRPHDPRETPCVNLSL
jgi:hypothetical protein